MTMTVDILKAIAPWSKKTNYKHLPGLALWMDFYFKAFEIDTSAEYCHFICQAAHETDSFNSLEEYASGKAYEGRKDLGNTVEGYGVKYKGRGIYMTTGYVNYNRLTARCPDEYDVDFVKNPELLNMPQWATWSACIYWQDKDFNTIANLPDTERIWSKKLQRNLSPLEYITLRINGGFNGYSDRVKFYERAKNIIT